MRYQVQSIFAGLTNTLQEASSFPAAEMLYGAALKSIREKETIQLIDSKVKSSLKVVRSHCQPSRAEKLASYIQHFTAFAAEATPSRNVLKKFAEEVAASVDTDAADAAGIDNDTTYAFKWASNAFEAAARIRVAQYISAWLGEGTSIRDIANRIQAEVVRSARFRPSSTSVPSNLMEQCILEQWARALEEAQFAANGIEKLGQ